MSILTPQVFRQGLALLGTTQAEFARTTGVNARTTRKWALGERPIPTWVGRYMALQFKVVRMERAAAVDSSVAPQAAPEVR